VAAVLSEAGLAWAQAELPVAARSRSPGVVWVPGEVWPVVAVRQAGEPAAAALPYQNSKMLKATWCHLISRLQSSISLFNLLGSQANWPLSPDLRPHQRRPLRLPQQARILIAAIDPNLDNYKPDKDKLKR